MSNSGHSSTIDEMVKQIEEALKDVKHVIVVLSGKGGVGKSFIASALAIGLHLMGRSVAVFDADIHGSSIPWIFGLREHFLGVTMDGKIVPVNIGGISILSVELLMQDREQPLIWRGPLKTRTIIQLLTSTLWGSRDYMIVDLPPGTGDEPLTIAQFLRSKISGAILVTTPGKLVTHIVNKAKRFVEVLNIPLLGVIVNMAYFKCRKCGTEYRAFEVPDLGVKVLAEIPLDFDLERAIEDSKLLEFIQNESSETAKILKALAKDVDRMVMHGSKESKDSG